MPPSIIPMLAMPLTVPASRAGTDSFASGNVSIAAPAAKAQAISNATRTTAARPGTKTITAQSSAARMVPAMIGALRPPARCEIHANARPPSAHAMSIAEAVVAAALAPKPYCETRNGTPHRPANARTIPESAPGTTTIAHVVR